MLIESENIDYIFVYGTLMSKHKNKYANHLHSQAQLVGKGYCYGKLYTIDWYPGLVVSNSCNEIVTGELFSFQNTKIFEELDEYENTESGEYIRKKITVYTDSIIYNAWTYIYNWEIDENKKINPNNSIIK